MRINAVRQLDMDGHVRIFIGRLGDPAPVLDDIGFARGEGDVDRILADDCRQTA